MTTSTGLTLIVRPNRRERRACRRYVLRGMRDGAMAKMFHYMDARLARTLRRAVR